MPAIINPTPVTPATCDRMWVTHLNLVFPGEKNGILHAALNPYDGTHLLATGTRSLTLADLAHQADLDAELDALLANLADELRRLSGNPSSPVTLRVLAPDPAAPVTAIATFARGSHYQIADCFALVEEDAVFEEIFNATMAGIARISGLTTTI